MGIRRRILLAATIPSVLLLALLVLSWIRFERSRAIEQARGEALNIATYYAAEFDRNLERVAQVALSTGRLLSTAGLPDDEALYRMLEDNVLSDEVIFGSAIGFDPGTFADRELFGPYAYRDGDSIATLDVAEVAYDYTEPRWAWYREPRATGRAIWTDPFFDEGAGDLLMVTHSAPFTLADRAGGGVATVDVPITRIRDAVDVRAGEPIDFVLLTPEGTVVVDSRDSSMSGRPLSPDTSTDLHPDVRSALVSINGGGSGVVTLDAPDADGVPPSLAADNLVWAELSATDWSFVALVSDDDLRGVADAQTRGGLIVLGVTLLLALGMATLGARRLASPIVHLRDAASAVAAGESAGDSRLPRGDELGDLSATINTLAERLDARVQDVVHQQQRRFDGLLDSSPDAIFLTDMDAYVVQVNHATRSLFGYPGDRLVGQRADVLMSPEESMDRGRFPELFRRTAAGEGDGSQRVEIGCVTADGRLFPAEVVLQIIGTDDEERIVTIVRDISERREAEQAVADSERAFRMLFESNAVGLLQTDAQTHEILRANTQMANLLGRTPEDVRGRSAAVLTHPEDRPALLDRYTQMAVGDVDQAQVDLRLQRPDGGVVWVEVHLSAFRDADGVLQQTVASVVDLTDFRRQDALIQAVFDSSVDGYQLIEGTTTIAANEACADILDVPLDQLIGSSVTELPNSGGQLPDGTSADDAFLTALESVRAAGRPRRIDWAFTHADGTHVPADLTLVPIQLEERDVVLVVQRDLTVQKRAEDELRRAHAAASEAAEARSQFLATMSHEIRTPMNGILGMIDILGDTSLSAEQRQVVATIRDSSDALMRILNDVLDLSKADAGQLTVEREPVDLCELVDGVGRLMATSVLERDLMFITYTDPDLPTMVLGDDVRLRQVLTNLVSNARKFTRSGTITVRADRADDRLALTVSDTGIGMDPSQVERALKPYAQAERSTYRQFGGTGLGLSIVNRLVSSMGGQMEISSRPDEGTTVTMTLPLEAAPHSTQPQPVLDGAVVWAAVPHGLQRTVIRRYVAAVGGRVHFVGEPGDGIPPAPPGVLYVGRTLTDATRQEVLEATPASCPVLQGVGVIARADRPQEDWAEGRPVIPVPAVPLTRTVLLAAIGEALDRPWTATGPGPERGEDADDERVHVPAPASADAGGVSVLVVDDHPVNCEVLVRQVTRLGAQAVSVPSGEAALAHLRRTRVDLILTDLHMPGMDGRALAQSVRRAHGDDILIVAVTADVLSAEEESLREAGIDDVLTKPVRRPELRRVLARSRTASASATVDLTVLTATFGDDRAAIARIITEFLSQAEQTTDALRAALETRAAGDGGALAHKLRSSALMVGATQAAELSRAIEHACERNDWSAAHRAIEQLHRVLEQMKGDTQWV